MRTDTVTLAERNLRRTVCARIPTFVGEFQLCHYENDYDHKEHLALVFGEVNSSVLEASGKGGENILVRVHSECFTGDVLGSRRCDCGPQLRLAMELIAEAGSGVIVYLRQEGRGIGLEQKLRAYNLQDEGYDTVEANLLLGHQADERDYWAAAGILSDLGVSSINLLTNNPAKIEHLRELGIHVAARTPLIAGVTSDNRAYLEAKVERMRHVLDLPNVPDAPDLPPDLVVRLDDLRQRIAASATRLDRPFITVTYAQSLNGVIAGPLYEGIRLSSPGAMRMTHALRTLHRGILVGVGSILADDPRLTTRLVDGPSPQPIILDSHLRTPESARIFGNPHPVLIAAHNPDPARAARLRMCGAEVLNTDLDRPGRLDLEDLLGDLRARGITSVMVEGGATVIGEFLRQQLADQVIVTIAPRFESGVVALGEPSNGGVQSRNPDATQPLPAIANLAWWSVDGDLIAWGDPVWSEQPSPATAASS